MKWICLIFYANSFNSTHSNHHFRYGRRNLPLRYLPSAWLPRGNGSQQGNELPDVPTPEWSWWTNGTRPRRHYGTSRTQSSRRTHSLTIRIPVDGKRVVFTATVFHLSVCVSFLTCSLISPVRIAMPARIVKVDRVRFTRRRPSTMTQRIVQRKINMWENIISNSTSFAIVIFTFHLSAPIHSSELTRRLFVWWSRTGIWWPSQLCPRGGSIRLPVWRSVWRTLRPLWFAWISRPS